MTRCPGRRVRGQDKCYLRGAGRFALAGERGRPRKGDRGFRSKDEAIDYARSFAKAKSYSRVVVLNESGVIESEESFAMAAY